MGGEGSVVVSAAASECITRAWYKYMRGGKPSAWLSNQVVCSSGARKQYRVHAKERRVSMRGRSWQRRRVQRAGAEEAHAGEEQLQLRR